MSKLVTTNLRFRKRPIGSFSTSFEVMERIGVEAAFTFDRDVRDCGFRMLP